ncbi:MAG: PKD domain-containing protein, partial [Bacteroidetes bacterium]
MIPLGGYGQLTADFSSNVQAGCSPLTVQFINNSSGLISDYLWDFGNGNTSTLANPGAVYVNPGSYTVSLTVSNAASSDTKTLTGYITVYADPVANLQGDQLTGCAPLQVCFTDLSTPGDGTIDTWLWDFGDGVISSEPAPCHTYSAAGSYDVTLVVEDDNGCSNTLILPNYIEATSPHSADFSVSSTTPCTLPADVQFTSTVSPAGAYTYLWDFGDGNTSTLANPLHTYTSGGSYSVSLVVRDASGCQDSLAKEDVVNIQAPSAAFNVLNTNACTGQAVQFLNNSGGADAFFWDFGDGSSSVQREPLHAYQSTGTYTVSLIATNSAQGCSDTLVQTALINVSNSPVADFSSPNRSGCEVPKVVDFVDASTGATAWQWDFGDGTTASVQNPSHIYAAGGNYTVRLVVTNAAGCRDTLTQPAYVQISPPVAEFVPSPTAGCIPLPVNFLDISSSQDPITDWIWNFGDGNASFEQHPTHTYTSVGQYTVSLVVLTQSGCRDTMIYQFIEAGEPPLTDFIANPLTVCAEDSVDFTDQTNRASAWLWSFGDGSFSDLQHPVHQYRDTGTFDVMLVTQLFGCPDTLLKEDYITVLGPIAEFTTSSTTGCQIPYTVNFVDQSVDADGWIWDFGDGNGSMEQNPVHTYTSLGTFTVTLIATNSQTGCSYQSTTELDISEPQANFTASNTYGCTGLEVDFSSTSTGAVRYAWDFGDGNTSRRRNPRHVYRDPGTYSVRLVVTNSAGCTDTLLRQDLITIVGPQGDFTADTTTGCAPLTVRFSATATTFPATESISSYFWDFGDGTTFTAQNPTYTYQAPDDYTLRLVILDTQGCTDTVTKQGFITPTFPAAAFSVADTVICPGSPVSFINESTGVGNSYLWDFGDGTTSTAIDPVHLYPATGTYSITLTATDINGCVHTTFIQDFLSVRPPIANFFAAPTQQACPPLAVNFSDLSSPDVVSWHWDFGDGSTSDLPNPSKIYGIPGAFDVSLTVENAQGCRDTLLLQDLVELGGPAGSFSFTPKTGCSPLEVAFSAATDSAVSWTWDFGDGSLGFGKNTTHVYTTDTTAKPVLIVRDTAGCTVAITVNDSIVIEPGPEANFSVDLTQVCLGQAVSFRENTTSVLPVIQYQWDFGDGNTSLQANPQHIYTSPGNYQVSLAVASLNGCTDTFITAVPIQVSEPPDAIFTPSVTQGCAPLEVTFTDQSTSMHGIDRYLWVFGDGDSASVPFPAHTFLSPGNYRVRLEITDNLGCSDSSSQVITVTGPPVADFTASARMGCAPREIQFSDLSSGPSTLTAWFWEFGDGNTSAAQHPLHTYTQNGIYTVSLTVTDENGCTHTEVKPEYIQLRNPIADFSANTTQACPPQLVQFTPTIDTQVPITNYIWDFGDSTRSNEPSPQHLFAGADTFDVQLIVINALGCADTVLKPGYIKNYRPPMASFVPSDTVACAPASLSFVSNSSGGLAPITSYVYEFGNGDTARTPLSSYAFTQAGTYTVSLVVRDFNGCADTARRLLSINPPIQANFGF